MKFNHDKLIVDNLKDLIEELQDAIRNLKNSSMHEFSIIGKCIIAFYEQSQQKNKRGGDANLKCIYDYFDTIFENDIVLILQKDSEEYLLTRKDVATVFRAYDAHFTTNKRGGKYGVLKEYIQEIPNVKCLWYEGIFHAASPEQISYHDNKNDTYHPIADIKISIEGAKTTLKNSPSIVERVLLGIYFDFMEVYNSRSRNTGKMIIMFQGGSNPDFVKSETLHKLMLQYLVYPNICKESFILPYKIKKGLEEDGYKIIEESINNFGEIFKEKNGLKELVLKWNMDQVIFYSESNNSCTRSHAVRGNAYQLN